MKVKSGRTAIEDFMESTVWADIQEYVKESIDLCRQSIEGEPFNAERIASLIGSINTWKSVLELPSMLLIEIEGEEESDGGQ